MRKVILFNFMTLDGFFEGANKELDWHNVDKEFIDFANEQLGAVSMLLFGRHTYQMMESYWTSEMTKQNDPVTVRYMNTMPKIVFSKTLNKAEWNNTRLIKNNIEKEIMELKNMEGKDMMLLGSADLADALQKAGLIDEYRIMIDPIILGSGTPHFKKSNKRINLNLINTRVFGNGNVLLYYQPKQ
jgi:dihydrofolate reductase